MHLSIFNFSAMKSSHGLVFLMFGILQYFIGLEIAMRTVVPQISQVERRHNDDHQRALQVMQKAHDGFETVLVVGNSLLQQGIDREELLKATPPKYRIALFPVENTTYWDWYFGLRRLAREGAAPDVVVLCLNLRQILSNSTNGEGFAHSMMQVGDIVQVARATRLDMTVASNYFFANFSAWLGGRSFIRNWILEKWIPGASALVQLFAAPGRAAQGKSSSTAIPYETLQRLKALQALCKTIGAKFVFLIPPTTNSTDLTSEVQLLAAQADIPVIVPFKPGEMETSVFSDGFHLNAEGAKRFSERLGGAFEDALSARKQSSMRN